MKETSKLGGFLLPAYVLPFLFSGLLTQPISKFMGKKKASFLSGLGIGISLLLVGLVSQPIFIIALVCLSSVFSSIAMPEMSAVFEDYAQRLGKTGEDIVGLQSSAGSLAYILGPIMGGLLATFIGNHLTLSVIGLLSLSVSIICLIVVPKKIRMPQAEIAQLAN
jgi:DHA1 family multidrug resistance protein-like MFS transporter